MQWAPKPYSNYYGPYIIEGTELHTQLATGSPCQAPAADAAESALLARTAGSGAIHLIVPIQLAREVGAQDVVRVQIDQDVPSSVLTIRRGRRHALSL